MPVPIILVNEFMKPCSLLLNNSSIYNFRRFFPRLFLNHAQVVSGAVVIFVADG